jgi:hypothetical protein
MQRARELLHRITPRGFLLVNGAGYLALGLLEFAAVYGGLEAGMGVFFLVCAKPHLQRTGVLFALCAYAGIVLFRASAMVLYGSPTSGIGWLLFATECAFLAVSVALARKLRPLW